MFVFVGGQHIFWTLWENIEFNILKFRALGIFDVSLMKMEITNLYSGKYFALTQQKRRAGCCCEQTSAQLQWGRIHIIVTPDFALVSFDEATQSQHVWYDPVKPQKVCCKLHGALAQQSTWNCELERYEAATSNFVVKCCSLTHWHTVVVFEINRPTIRNIIWILFVSLQVKRVRERVKFLYFQSNVLSFLLSVQNNGRPT